MKRISVTVLPVLFATPALAHTGHVPEGALAAGLAHPLSGADHVLAMVAVGLWAATLGGRAIVAVPGAFVAAMVAGFALALAGVWLPAVEPMILASVVFLGLAVAAALRPAPAVAAAVVSGFALFHGHAHGAGIAGAGASAFGAGVTLATAALHAAGLALGLSLARGVSARLLGAGTALAAAALAAG